MELPNFEYTRRLAGRILEELQKDPQKYINLRYPTANDAKFSLLVIRPPEGCENKIHKRYSYGRLPTLTSIRLLKINPLSEASEYHHLFMPLECSILVKDLKDPEDRTVYDALSYTWGDPQTLYDNEKDMSSREAWAGPAFEIRCDGEPVSVSTNLYTALLSFRWMITMMNGQPLHPGNELTGLLWIDALCINQADLEERSSQVLMMDKIYRQAEGVFAWLGGSNDGAKRALSHLRSIATWSSGADITIMKGRHVTDLSLYQEMGVEPITYDDWVEIVKLCRRSWFTRAWVAQEVILAKRITLFCGLVFLQGSGLCEALSTLAYTEWLMEASELIQILMPGQSRKEPVRDFDAEAYRNIHLGKKQRSLVEVPGSSGIVREPIYAFLRSESFAFGGTEQVSYQYDLDAKASFLWENLDKFRELQASNPKDKVYAFMGVSREFMHGNTQLVPRYDQSQTVESVYLEAASFMAQSPGHLNFLALKETVTTLKLPSWTPDFSVQSQARSVVRGRGWFEACGTLDPHSFQIIDKILHVKAVSCGTIKQTQRYDMRDPFSSLRLLETLPEFSLIWQPPKFTVKMTPRDAPTTMIRRKPVSDGWSVKSQSRLEVLWRTLIFDNSGTGMMPTTQPAPEVIRDVFLSTLDKMEKAYWHACQKSIMKQHYPNLFRSWESTASDDKAKRVWQAAPDITKAREGLSRIYAAKQVLTGKLPYGSKVISGHPAFQAQERIGVWNYMSIMAESEDRAEHLLRQFGITDEYPDKSLWGQLLAALNGRQNRRHLVTVDDGNQRYLGSAVVSAEVGDEVWVLAGCKVPLVLRPAGKGRYHLVCDAYVHGIMYGEAVPDDPQDASVQEICLV